MAAIYVKALKRKDFSGISNKDGPSDDKAGDAKGKASAEKKEDANKAGAGTGKIVNLMSSGMVIESVVWPNRSSGFRC